MKTVIHWFRRDLRVNDNTALSHAARRTELVLPVFILEDAFKTGPDVGPARLAFLLRSLEALRQNLEARGYPLIIRQGRSEVELPKLCRDTKAETVFCNRRYEPYAQSRDSRVCDALNSCGVGFEIFKDAVAWEESDLLTKAGRPFTVFAPYARAWNARCPSLPRPSLRRTSIVFPGVRSDPLPTDPAELGHPLSQTLASPGETAAREMLRRFLSGPVYVYAERRDFPAVDGTSHLSAHLRCGTIGIRAVLHLLSRARALATTFNQQKGCDAFLNELIWREFCLQVLANFPHVMTGSFRRESDALPWSDNTEWFQAWCAGQTGYPIVDAAMRCLKATGWMHNRLRMITAMFLTKDLLLNWQWGERYFMRQLVDGDLAANNGGWQWCAGTGTDAAPYFRIFNPVIQARNFDPDGAFIRQWVPELAHLPTIQIHQPWENPGLASKRVYPQRLVLHAEQRAKCLAMFRSAKEHR